MITLDTGNTLVGIKVAKLAKNIGYYEDCLYSYYVNNKGNLFKDTTEIGSLCGIDLKNDYNNYSCEVRYYYNMNKNYVSAPTQTALKKWIFKTQNIIIVPFFSSDLKWYYNIKKLPENLNSFSKKGFESEEEALEEALEETLINIGENK